ncbi:MAG TPA: hypothetical protein VJQ08_07100 [Candidatus Dormibacteraeota bacterium]|nr:hypothetical protein [Candidatus Dormibacteraeota bacterium]
MTIRQPLKLALGFPFVVMAALLALYVLLHSSPVLPAVHVGTGTAPAVTQQVTTTVDQASVGAYQSSTVVGEKSPAANAGRPTTSGTSSGQGGSGLVQSADGRTEPCASKICSQ